MNRYSLACCLTFAAVLAVAHPSPGIAQTPGENSEARRLFNEGVEFQHDGNLVEAEKKFREALRKYPKAEQSDKTAYYLIDTLDKLRRIAEARVEIDNFRKNYPQSRWLPDVNYKIVRLGGQPAPPAELGIWNTPDELRKAQDLADRLRGARTPDGPPDKIYADDFPVNASMNAELLRQIIRADQEMGINEAQERLKKDPSDPEVAANLGTIANSGSPQAIPFLLKVWGSTATRQNIRNTALFWIARRNPNKEDVAKAIMDLLSKRETEAVASEALYRLTVADHRAVLEKIVMSSNPEKFSAIEKIYRNGSSLLRTDLLMFVAMLLNDPKAVPFLMNAAQNDKDLSVRRTAVGALEKRKDIDVDTLQTLKTLLNAPPPAPPRVPVRVPQPLPFTGSAIPSLNGFPSTQP
jgi:tetratricopeptide (TPR) repeat protein